MKRVSFKVAKAIKEAGYPQDYTEFYYDYNGCIQKRSNCYVNCKCVAPTYLDIWLWLWREKKAMLNVDGFELGMAEVVIYLQNSIYNTNHIANDPEEAIIAAIEYLVEQKMI